MAKKESEPKKGSGSDIEKSPTNPEPMEEVDSTKPEEPKSEPPAEEMDTQPEPAVTENDAKSEPPVAENEAQPEVPATDKDMMDVDPAEDFVVIEGGGEGDDLAQEKATAREKEKENGENIASEKETVGAGAQLPNDVDSVAAPEPIAKNAG